MHKIITLVFILIFTENLLAQNSTSTIVPEKNISHNDSVLLKKYIAGYKNTALYSNDHQLNLDSILTIEPHNAFYWQQKGMPLCKQRKYELGMTFIDSAVKYNENNYIDYRAFMKCIFQKSYLAAIKDFERAKKLKGDAHVMDHSYDFFMGLCFLQLNQFNRADSLIQFSINNSIASGADGHYLEYFYLGICKMEKKQDSLAISLFDNALKSYPQFPDAKFYKAICLDHLGETAFAKQIINEGLADLNNGYSNNEDNEVYEDYPYEKRKFAYEYTAKSFN